MLFKKRCFYALKIVKFVGLFHSLILKIIVIMGNKLKIGIIKETKIPVDHRVVLPPKQAKELLDKYASSIEIVVQRSDIRSFKDEEYEALGFSLVDSVDDCDWLIGVKEVQIDKLISNKNYVFFSHTAKKQSYNRPLLQAIMQKQITLVDHEYLTDKNGIRLVAFGYWAGLVGAYNGLIAYGKKTGTYSLKPAYQCHDKDEVFAELKKITIKEPIKILLTGGGRVAGGAMDTLDHLGIKKVSPEDYLAYDFDYPVYAQIDPWHYTRRKDGEPFDLQHFFEHPDMYESTFEPYPKVTDMWVACHFWDPKSPVFLTKEDYKKDDFRISIIADVSCDIAEPIPSTLRASTIDDPLYGYDKFTEKEVDAFAPNAVTVMAVDNLRGELPRNASEAFGEAFVQKVFPSIIDGDHDGVIERATIVKEGKLPPLFSYLEDFAAGKE